MLATQDSVVWSPSDSSWLSQADVTSEAPLWLSWAPGVLIAPVSELIYLDSTTLCPSTQFLTGTTQEQSGSRGPGLHTTHFVTGMTQHWRVVSELRE